MRIAFCNHTTTKDIVDEFIKKWKMYTYVPIPQDDDYAKAEETADSEEDVYKTMLNNVIRRTCELQVMNDPNILTGKKKKSEFVLYDNSMLNCLADTFLLAELGLLQDSEFITSAIMKTKNMFKHLDIIFLLKDVTEIEDNWMKASQALLLQFEADYWKAPEDRIIFNAEDIPSVITIPYHKDHLDKTINAISEYLSPNGTVYDPGQLSLEDIEESQETIDAAKQLLAMLNRL